jgi:hypothetical protein
MATVVPDGEVAWEQINLEAARGHEPPMARTGHTATEINGVVYVFAGASADTTAMIPTQRGPLTHSLHSRRARQEFRREWALQ